MNNIVQIRPGLFNYIYMVCIIAHLLYILNTAYYFHWIYVNNWKCRIFLSSFIFYYFISYRIYLAVKNKAFPPFGKILGRECTTVQSKRIISPLVPTCTCTSTTVAHLSVRRCSVCTQGTLVRILAVKNGDPHLETPHTKF